METSFPLGGFCGLRYGKPNPVEQEATERTEGLRNSLSSVSSYKKLFEVQDML
jgi:hypothetical protein